MNNPSPYDTCLGFKDHLYFKGDEIELTGTRFVKHGIVWFNARYIDGHQAGSELVVSNRYLLSSQQMWHVGPRISRGA